MSNRPMLLLAHAAGEESVAELLAGPLKQAGYEVAHRGTVVVGKSIVEDASRLLQLGAPVIVCGTVRALGTGQALRVINAARDSGRNQVLVVKMEEEAYVELISDGVVAEYWRDPVKAVNDLLRALSKIAPTHGHSAEAECDRLLEDRYRASLLEFCDIIDLANLPESDRHIAVKQLELRRLYVALRAVSDVQGQLTTSDAEVASTDAPSDDSASTHVRPRPVPFGQFLSVKRRVVLLGDPGAGKTTLVRWLATCYLLRLSHDPAWEDVPGVHELPQGDYTPIVIRCRELEDAELAGSLDDFLRQTLRKSEFLPREVEVLVSYLRAKMTDGSAILLIDGLDEISNARVRAAFARQIERIHVALPKAMVVATSRIVGYREMGYRIGKGFAHARVAELSRQDKDDFATRWCALTEPPQRRRTATAELIADIHSAERIEQLTGNPMLLTTMALVKRKVGKLPSRRADLYWSAVEVLLNWRREVDEPLDQREAVPQLEYVAFVMCDRGTTQLREDELVDLIRSMRSEYPQVHPARNHSPEEFIELLERRTGIIAQSGHARHLGRPAPVFEFRHLTFQEYLAGLALVDKRFPGHNPTLSLAEHIAPIAGHVAESGGGDSGQSEVTVSENWSEALRLCVASCADHEVDSTLKAIAAVPDGDDPAYVGRPRAVLSLLCLSDEPNVSENIALDLLHNFTRYINKGDGLGPSPITSADSAVAAVLRSRWRVPLRVALIRELLSRSPQGATPVTGLVASSLLDDVPATGNDVRLFLQGAVEQMNRGSNSEVVEGLVKVVVVAYSGWGIRVKRQVESLLRILSGPVSECRGLAAWALQEMAKGGWGGDRVSHGWRPTSRQAESIARNLDDPELDGVIRDNICRIFIHAPHDNVVQRITRLLANRSTDTATVACRAIAAAARAGLEIDNVRVSNELRRLLETVRTGQLHSVFEALVAVEPTDLAQLIDRALSRVSHDSGTDDMMERLMMDLAARGHEAALSALRKWLPSEEFSEAATRALLFENPTACKLLSRDLDGLLPMLAIDEPMSAEHIRKARRQLRLSEADIAELIDYASVRLGVVVRVSAR